MIELICGKRFIITRFTNLKAIISSLLNLIVLMNLFQNSLFPKIKKKQIEFCLSRHLFMGP